MKTLNLKASSISFTLFMAMSLLLSSTLQAQTTEWGMMLPTVDGIGHTSLQGIFAPGNLCKSGNVDRTGFLNPTYMAYDAVNRRLYITDEGNARVIVYERDQQGNFSPLAVLGQPANDPSGCLQGYENVNSDRESLNRFYFKPGGLALWRSGTTTYLFVAELSGRILVFDVTNVPTDGMSATFSFGDGNGVNPGDNTARRFNNPRALKIRDDRIYIHSLGDYRVVVYDLNVLIRNRWAQQNPLQIFGQANTSSRTSGTNTVNFHRTFSNSYGMAVSQRYLWFADEANSRVLGYLRNAATPTPCTDNANIECRETADIILGGGTSNTIIRPRGLGTGFFGNGDMLFVVDTRAGGERIIGFDLATIATGSTPTRVLGAVNINPNSIILGEGLNAFNQRILPSADVLLISENNTRQLLTAQYNQHRVLGFDVTNGFGVFGTSTATARFVLGQESLFHLCENGPIGPTAFSQIEDTEIYSGRSGRWLFVSDSKLHRVVAWQLDERGRIQNLAQPAIIGQPNANSCYHWTTNQLGHNRKNGLYSPQRMTVHAYNDMEILFVTDFDQHRVLGYDLAEIARGGQVDAVLQIGYALRADQTQFDFTAEFNSSVQARLPRDQYVRNPGGIASDDTYLYIAEYQGNRVSAWRLDEIRDAIIVQTLNDGRRARPTGASTIVTMSPLRAAGVLGASTPNAAASFAVSTSACGGLRTLTAPNNQQALCYPHGIGVDDRYLYVGDITWSRILVFPKDRIAGTDKSAIAVIGQPNFSSIGVRHGTGGNGTLDGQGFSAPRDVNVFNTTLFVTDITYNRILAFPLPTDQTPPQSNIVAIAIFGQVNSNTIRATAPTFTASDGSFLWRPISVNTFEGRLFVGDDSNNVKIYQTLDVTLPVDRVVHVSSASQAPGINLNATIQLPICRGDPSNLANCIPFTSRWQDASGAPGVILNNQDQLQSSVILPGEGSYPLRFTAQVLGNSITRQMSVDVLSTPTEGYAFRYTVGDRINLDAMQTTGQTRNFRYQWTLRQGPQNSQAPLSATSSALTFDAQIAGTYLYSLQVSPNSGTGVGTEIPFSLTIDPQPDPIIIVNPNPVQPDPAPAPVQPDPMMPASAPENTAMAPPMPLPEGTDPQVPSQEAPVSAPASPNGGGTSAPVAPSCTLILPTNR